MPMDIYVQSRFMETMEIWLSSSTTTSMSESPPPQTPDDQDVAVVTDHPLSTAAGVMASAGRPLPPGGVRASSGAVHKQFLSCGICLERYNSPKVLPCLHTFCASCLHGYIPAHSLSVTCPTCRHQSILPEPGVSALQDNVFILNLMGVLDSPQCARCSRDRGCSGGRATFKCTTCAPEVFLCDECVVGHGGDSDCPGDSSECSSHEVVSLNELSMSSATAADNDVHQESKKMVSLVCPNHDGQSLEFYCTACETAICEDCTLGEHSTHRTLLLSEAIMEHKEMLNDMLEKAQHQIPTIQEAIQGVEQVERTLLDNYKDVEVRINDAFDSLTKMILERKDLVLSDLEFTYSAKQKTLNEQQENLRNMLTSINSCCDFTENALKHGNETEVLLVRKEMTEKLSQLSSQEVQKMPEENDFLAFNDGEFVNMKKFLNGLGSIQSNSAIAFETIAMGDGLKKCYINHPTTVSITTKDKNGDLIKMGQSSFSAHLTSSDGNISVPAIVDNKNGTYEITYKVSDPDMYKLDIKLYGQPIKGSPFHIKALKESDSLERISSKIPKTMAVKQRGTKRPSSIHSVGSSNRRSNMIEDDMIVRVGVKGRNKGEFTNPQGVCTVVNKVIVADSNNQCIQVFNNGGDFKQRFGVRGRLVGQLQRPTGIAVTLNGNFLVADYDNKWVSVHGPDGKYINKIGNGKLLGPKGVAVDSNGRIIVVDNKASCIFVFASNGKLLHKFGSRGNEEDQFAGPHFCAVNAQNDIIVSDFHNHCIKVFDSEGQFMFSFGSNGEGNGQFNAPTGIAVDRHGNILVADWGNSRIQIFDSTGSFLSYINTSGDPLYGPQGLAITDDNQVVVADSGNHCIKTYRYLQ